VDVLGAPEWLPVGCAGGRMHALFSAFGGDYCEEKDARELILYSLRGPLLVWLNRQCHPAPPAKDKAERRRSIRRPFARLI
ncbi:AraC family transcriptional regulator, partial [Klebsiella pneumoniae]